MAGVCCGIVGETETKTAVEVSSGVSRRRRLEVHQFKLRPAVDLPFAPLENERKRQKTEVVASPETEVRCESESESPATAAAAEEEEVEAVTVEEFPKFGMTSVRGRRREMEDAVAIHPSFHRRESPAKSDLHFYGVYDGHGCSHVAVKCKDRMHEIVKEEIENEEEESSWKDKMEKSFARMDKEVTERRKGDVASSSSVCKCELQTPQCDAVGSTAVVAVVSPEKIVVSNTGDSRAVLCRNGVAIPLSVDHKPDRPDELLRIENAGGRVIYWDGARVLGVLAMSRAIGDSYLKPYVISEPEVTVTERTVEDELLILASDGLWDVVSNETACNVALMCLRSQKPPSPPRSPGAESTAAGEGSDKACSDASVLLTKLALARHSSDNVSVVVVDLRRNRENHL